jgi:hypothetical protein
MVQAARKAILIGVIRLDRPVAHRLVNIVAAQSKLLGCISRCNRSPEVVSNRFESADDSGIGKERQRVIASRANEALEKDRLIAATALEDLHVSSLVVYVPVLSRACRSSQARTCFKSLMKSCIAV